ncbi:methyltransferase domain-containing protein [Okeania sp.]|uniref:class I SAM-dependent methyltransferase n=1 Tax=Okeania sp. TaxID=3100323 RepID=UPI002B4B8D86|nr:methyltransferase domain-containing protein [Okeania sp.]MEB3340265.1 methyltransferase domain-containing protein [Okeania sp.]
MKLKLDPYKQKLAEVYDNDRSQNYDQNQWLPQITHRLVESVEIKPGNQVLDIATGTGHVAIEVAQLLGNSGLVVGVDISTKMIEKAREKATALKLKNIEFQLADGENINFPDNSFDLILCANAFPLMINKEATLRLWSKFLKPGGFIGLHSIAETGFTNIIVLKKILENHGINIDFFQLSNTVNTIEKYDNLLRQANLEVIFVKTETHGSYRSLEEAKKKWNLVYYPSPVNNNPHPFTKLSTEKIEQMKAEFELELEKFTTPEGIWNNGTTFLVLGRKSVSQ